MNKYMVMKVLCLLLTTFCTSVYANLPEGAKSFVRPSASGLSEYNSTLRKSGFRVGKSYALVVGIYEYEKWKSFSWNDSDLRRMEESLFDIQGFDEVIVLEQEHVSSESIAKVIEYFEKKISARDRFLFYFSGHGVDVDNQFGGKTGVLPTVRSPENIGLGGDGISMDELRDWYKKISNANHSLFILDSCFSGLAGHETKGLTGVEEFRINRLLNNGHYLITAGSHNQNSIGGARWGGSLFTSLIVRGMSGEADIAKEDGIVSFSELVLFTKNELDEILASLAEGERNSGFQEKTEMTPLATFMSAYKSTGEMFFIPEANNIKIEYEEVQAAANPNLIQIKGKELAERINYQDEYLRDKDNKLGDYFTIVGSFKDYREARRFAREIREKHKDIYAVVYDRYEGSQYYGVMLAAFVDKEKARKARIEAVERGIAKDAYIWTFPK